MNEFSAITKVSTSYTSRIENRQGPHINIIRNLSERLLIPSERLFEVLCLNYVPIEELQTLNELLIYKDFKIYYDKVISKSAKESLIEFIKNATLIENSMIGEINNLLQVDDDFKQEGECLNKQ